MLIVLSCGFKSSHSCQKHDISLQPLHSWSIWSLNTGERSTAGQQCSAVEAVQPSGDSLRQREEHRVQGFSAHAGCAL